MIRDSLGYAMHVINIYNDGIFNLIFCHHVVWGLYGGGVQGGGGGWGIQCLENSDFAWDLFFKVHI